MALVPLILLFNAMLILFLVGVVPAELFVLILFAAGPTMLWLALRETGEDTPTENQEPAQRGTRRRRVPAGRTGGNGPPYELDLDTESVVDYRRVRR